MLLYLKGIAHSLFILSQYYRKVHVVNGAWAVVLPD